MIEFKRLVNDNKELCTELLTLLWKVCDKSVEAREVSKTLEDLLYK